MEDNISRLSFIRKVNDEAFEQLKQMHEEGNLEFAKTLDIDIETLWDDRTYNIIKNYDIYSVRIANEKYKLTQKDYDRLKFVSKIIFVDYYDKNIVKDNNPGIIPQNNMYKMGIEKESPEKNSNYYYTFHITKKLRDFEIENIIRKLNRFNDKNILTELQIDIYEINYVYKLIKTLKEKGLNDSTKISLIGYEEEDKINIEKYDIISNYNNPTYILSTDYYPELEAMKTSYYIEYIEYFLDRVKKYELKKYVDYLKELHLKPNEIIVKLVELLDQIEDEKKNIPQEVVDEAKRLEKKLNELTDKKTK